MEKTQGMMVGSSCTDDRLPSINWQNQSIKILGFQIGNVNPRTIWHDSLESLRKQKLLINVPFQTWQAKSLLAKSKHLPQITYNAYIYLLDTTSRRLIETEFLNYLTNNPTISLSMKSLQKPINDGGIKFPNTTTYCDLIYISNFFQYFKTRGKNKKYLQYRNLPNRIRNWNVLIQTVRPSYIKPHPTPRLSNLVLSKDPTNPQGI